MHTHSSTIDNITVRANFRKGENGYYTYVYLRKMNIFHCVNFDFLLQCLGVYREEQYIMIFGHYRKFTSSKKINNLTLVLIANRICRNIGMYLFIIFSVCSKLSLISEDM